MSEFFDLNDPRLADLPVEDFDPNGSLIQIPPAPPSDGIHRISLTLREGENAIRIKSDEKGTRIVAQFVPRFVKEDGTLGGFLKDFYATSMVPNGQSTSSIAVLCRAAGHPTRRFENFAEYVKHVQAAFSPETPFEVSAKTQWRRAIPYDDGNGGVQWTDINGEAAVKARSVEDVLRFKSETNFPPQTLALLEANPHLYYDERAGEVKAVQAQVRSIEE